MNSQWLDMKNVGNITGCAANTLSPGEIESAFSNATEYAPTLLKHNGRRWKKVPDGRARRLWRRRMERLDMSKLARSEPSLYDHLLRRK